MRVVMARHVFAIAPETWFSFLRDASLPCQMDASCFSSQFIAGLLSFTSLLVAKHLALPPLLKTFSQRWTEMDSDKRQKPSRPLL